MIIKNAKVFNEKSFEYKDIFIQNGIITTADEGLSNVDDKVIDATGLLALPGLVDIHFHGAMGHDFCDTDEDGLKAILDYEASQGIMAVSPATMTYPEDVLTKVIDNARKVSSYTGGAKLVGINMEGPFISPQKVAAQNPDYVMAADSNMFRRLLDRADGLIKLVDIAPEEAGNMDFIDEFKDEVIISLAHTTADYDTAKEAYQKGATHLTHTFNAMNGINHRAPGPILAAYEEGANVELISDGVHIHDSIIRMVFDLFGEDRVILISDSMMAAGLGDGHYMLGGQSVDSVGNLCRLSEHPDVIAGSNTNLFNCMKHAILSAKVPMIKAVKAATVNPAKVLGIDDKYGSLKTGAFGNVILCNESLEIKYLIKDGMIRG